MAHWRTVCSGAVCIIQSTIQWISSFPTWFYACAYVCIHIRICSTGIGLFFFLNNSRCVPTHTRTAFVCMLLFFLYFISFSWLSAFFCCCCSLAHPVVVGANIGIFWYSGICVYECECEYGEKPMKL